MEDMAAGAIDRLDAGGVLIGILQRNFKLVQGSPPSARHANERSGEILTQIRYGCTPYQPLVYCSGPCVLQCLNEPGRSMFSMLAVLTPGLDAK